MELYGWQRSDSKRRFLLKALRIGTIEIINRGGLGVRHDSIVVELSGTFFSIDVVEYSWRPHCLWRDETTMAKIHKRLV